MPKKSAVAPAKSSAKARAAEDDDDEDDEEEDEAPVTKKKTTAVATKKKTVVVDEDEDDEDDDDDEEPAPKKAVVAKKKTVVVDEDEDEDDEDDDEDDEDEEEEEAPKKTVKATAKKNGKVAAKGKKAKVVEAEGYTPNKNSMRDFVMRAMKKGGSSQAIKKRAAVLAEKAGVDDLNDPKKYKNFDVAYFAKFLKDKGLDVDIDEEEDKYVLNV